MARPRQPIDLLLHKGKKHLTKKEVEERKSTEVKAKSNNIKAPNYLDRKLKIEFNKISKELIEIGIMSNLDIDCLARFLIVQKEFLKITKAVEARGPTKFVEVEKKNKDGEVVLKEIEIIDDDYERLLSMQNKIFKTCRVAASDLGLSISSRCRLVMPVINSDNGETKTEGQKRFGDRI